MPDPSSSLIVAELKRTLREQGLTYADVARQLKLSLPTVKRMFSRGEFTLARIGRICELAGSSLADVVERSRERGAPTRQLTLAQEQEIASDPKLLLITWLVVNRETAEDIVSNFNLTGREVLKYLIRLDRLKVIELQPGNRVRLLVSRHFNWRPGGPLQRFIHERLLKEFFASAFDGPYDEFYFHGSTMTDTTLAALQRALRNAARECAGIVDATRGPPKERRGAAIVVALRRWSYSGFRPLERWQQPKRDAPTPAADNTRNPQ